MEVNKAKKYDQVEKSLITIFKEQQKLEDTKLEIRKKSFIPIRSAINKIEGKIGDVLDQNTNLMNLVPVVQNFADIWIWRIFLPASTPYEPIREDKVIEDSTFIDPSLVSPLNKIIGKIAQKYLPRVKDDKFGLYWNKNKNTFMVGDKKTIIDNDDLFIIGKKYQGTHGLWRLLTYNTNPDKHLYEDVDLKIMIIFYGKPIQYIKIMILQLKNPNLVEINI